MAEVPSGYANIEGSERRAVPGAERIGPADPGELISLSILVRRRPDAQPLPDHKYWMAMPAARRRYLSREELGSLHGAAQDDVDKVVAFARAQGFEITDTSLLRRTVFASCTVEQANRAFAVDLDYYEVALPERRSAAPAQRKQRYRSHVGAVAVPADLVGIIAGVLVWIIDRLYSERTTAHRQEWSKVWILGKWRNSINSRSTLP